MLRTNKQTNRQINRRTRKCYPRREHNFHVNKLCRGHGIHPIAVTFVEQFHINHAASATPAFCLVISTFDLLTLKLVSIVAHEVGNLPNNFGVNTTLDVWVNICQTHHVTLRP